MIDIRSPKAKKIATIIVLLFIACAAMLARSWNAYDHVFSANNEVKMLGVDSFFHLRHAKYTVENFPDIQRHDIGAAYPHGRQNDATGLFGLAISSVALLVFGKDATLNEIATVAVWFTPILAVIAHILLFILLKKLVNTPVALIATGLFLLYPGKSLDRSVLGFVDHHAAEYCLSLAICIGLVTFFRSARLKQQKRYWQSALFAASPMLLLFYTWQGALLFLLIVIISLFFYWSVLFAQNERLNSITHANMHYGVVMLPLIILSHGDLFLLLTGTLILISSAWIYSWVVARMTSFLSPKLIALSMVLALIAFAITLTTFTSLGQYFFSLVLSNSTNLIYEESPATVAKFLKHYGVVGILAVIGVPLTLLLIWIRKLPYETIIPLIIGLIWFSLWWRSYDFDYTLATFVAFNASISLYAIWLLQGHLLSAQRSSHKKWANGTIISVLVVAIAVPIYPLNVVSLPWVEKSKVQSMTIYSNAWYSAMDWLKARTPQPARTPLTNINLASPNTENKANDYGVLVSWDFGNIVASHGNRIPIWSSLPSSFTPHWWLAQNEQESLTILAQTNDEEHALRYVIVDKDTYGPFIHSKSRYINKPISTTKEKVFNVNGVDVPHYTLDNIHKKAMVTQLYANDGIELSHYRMVYESPEQTYSAGLLQINKDGDGGNYNYTPQTFPIDTEETLKRYTKWSEADVVDIGNGYLYNQEIHSTIKIFEVVKGTKINGQVQPGDTIQARLNLHSKTTDRHFTYTRTTIANEQGYFQLTVPYSTDNNLPNSDVVATENYKIWIRPNGETEYKLKAQVQVTESSFGDRRLDLKKSVDSPGEIRGQ